MHAIASFYKRPLPFQNSSYKTISSSLLSQNLSLISSSSNLTQNFHSLLLYIASRVSQKSCSIVSLAFCPPPLKMGDNWRWPEYQTDYVNLHILLRNPFGLSSLLFHIISSEFCIIIVFHIMHILMSFYIFYIFADSFFTTCNFSTRKQEHCLVNIRCLVYAFIFPSKTKILGVEATH
ncbi:hypothetical protein V8G54_003172 [Vigna mungo]|uniref:Uncharacterized protein n=1 Tax=Vigna mungo TaxID=3915 RepID=A0AAQ3PAH9_VIGMU